MAVGEDRQILAVLLPSKGRFLDLLLTLLLVPVNAQSKLAVHFVVCANYGTVQLAVLRSIFRRRATFLDERKMEWRGMIGAYNYAYEAARKLGARWVVLWADDLLPEKRSWLDDLFAAISKPAFQFGIFSSDEGNHKGRFGWNVFAGYPCAHFYVSRVDALPGYLLNPKLKAYVGDNEIAISRVKAGVPIDLLAIRVIHQPTVNSTRTALLSSYRADLERCYELHPELRGKLDAIVLRGDLADPNARFAVDTGRQIRFNQNGRYLTFDEFRDVAPRTVPPLRLRAVSLLRRLWNEVIMSPRVALRRIVATLAWRVSQGRR